MNKEAFKTICDTLGITTEQVIDILLGIAPLTIKTMNDIEHDISLLNDNDVVPKRCMNFLTAFIESETFNVRVYKMLFSAIKEGTLKDIEELKAFKESFKNE